MTIEQKRKILERIVLVQKDIETLKQARIEAGITGFASATISSSGGSKSYTRIDLDKITSLINVLSREVEQLRNMLAIGRGSLIKDIPIVYS